MESLGTMSQSVATDLRPMGNVKSKSRRLVRHEKFDDPRVGARSRKSAKKKETRRAVRTKDERTSPTRSVFSLDEERQPVSHAIQSRGKIAGPLLDNTTIDIPQAFARSQVKRRRRRERREQATRKSGLLPSPRDEAAPRSRSSFDFEPRFNKPSHRRLYKSRSLSTRPSSSLSPDSMKLSSPSSLSSRNGIYDYYTDMLAECSSSEYQFDDDKNSIWATIAHGSKVTALAFSRRCENAEESVPVRPTLLAIGSETGTIVVLELYQEERTRTLGLDTSAALEKSTDRFRRAVEFQRDGKVRSLSFSPDGDWLVAGGDDCTASLIRLTYSEESGSLQALRLFHEHEREDRVYALQFDSSGTVVAIGGFDGRVAIAELRKSNGTASLELVHEIERKGLVLSLDWNPEGSKLVVGGSDRILSVIDASSWQVVTEIHLSSSLPTVSFNPFGTHVAAGGNDGTVSVVDVSLQKVIATVRRGGAKSSRIQAISWSTDGRFVAVGGTDDRCAIVETWSYATVHEIRRAGNVSCLVWSTLGETGGQYLAVGGDDSSVLIARASALGNDDNSSYYDSDELSSSASSSGFSDGSVSHHEWVLKDDSFADVEDLDLRISPSTLNVRADAAARITTVCFSRGKRTCPSDYMVISGEHGVVTVFNTLDFQATTQMTFDKPIHSMHFSHQSEVLALAGESGIIYIFDVGTWQLVKETHLSHTSVNALHFSRHDQRLAVGSFDGILTLLEPGANWEVAGEIDGSDAPILSLDWSSRHLAVGRHDGTITVHETDNVFSNFFPSQAELDCANVPVRSIAFGARGRFLAAGSDDCKVTVYYARGGWSVNHQISTPFPISHVRWSTDAKYLAFGGNHSDSGMRVVDTTTWTNVKQVCKHARNGISSLAWSNDDSYLVTASTSGCSVIDTDGWQLVQRLSAESDYDLVSEVPASPATAETTLGGDTYIEPTTFADVKGDSSFLAEIKRRWSLRPQVSRFLQTSALFLVEFEDSNAPYPLRTRVPCVSMLTLHVRWVALHEGEMNAIAHADGGEHLFTILRILDIAVAIMVYNIEGNESSVINGSGNVRFGLDERDTRSIKIWNEFWRLQDSRTPLVDANLIGLCDQLQ